MTGNNVSLFIDFEYFVYGAENVGQKPPSTAKLMEMAAEYGNIMSAKAFGESAVLDRYQQDLRTASIEAILCAGIGKDKRKNVTDFFMLDHIYQSAYTQGHIDTYVLVTGDGHFGSVTAFLRYRLQKKAIVMAYPDSASAELKHASNEFRELIREDEDRWTEDIQAGLIRFVYSGEVENKIITVGSTARHYTVPGWDERDRRRELVRLIGEGLFEQRVEELGNGEAVRRLYLNHSHPFVQQVLAGLDDGADGAV